MYGVIVSTGYGVVTPSRVDVNADVWFDLIIVSVSHNLIEGE